MTEQWGACAPMRVDRRSRARVRLSMPPAFCMGPFPTGRQPTACRGAAAMPISGRRTPQDATQTARWRVKVEGVTAGRDRHKSDWCAPLRLAGRRRPLRKVIDAAADRQQCRGRAMTEKAESQRSRWEPGAFSNDRCGVESRHAQGTRRKYNCMCQVQGWVESGGANTCHKAPTLSRASGSRGSVRPSVTLFTAAHRHRASEVTSP